MEDAAYRRDLRRAVRSMVKTTGVIGRAHLAPPKAFDNKTQGKEPRGFPFPRPVAPWSLGGLGAVEDRLSERSASCRPNSDFAALAGRSEANCRITINVDFLPQKSQRLQQPPRVAASIY